MSIHKAILSLYNSRGSGSGSGTQDYGYNTTVIYIRATPTELMGTNGSEVRIYRVIYLGDRLLSIQPIEWTNGAFPFIIGVGANNAVKNKPGLGTNSWVFPEIVPQGYMQQDLQP